MNREGGNRDPNKTSRGSLKSFITEHKGKFRVGELLLGNRIHEFGMCFSEPWVILLTQWPSLLGMLKALLALIADTADGWTVWVEK